MAYPSPFVKGLAPTQFIEGSVEEAERLLGGRLPELPPGELGDRDEIVYYVQHHPRLRDRAREYLIHLFLEFCPEARRGVRAASPRAEEEYAALLERTLVNSLHQDRRIGLVNLLWLSHSQEIAEVVTGLTDDIPELRRFRFAIHPLLAGFLRQVWQESCREVERDHPGRLGFLLGSAVQGSLADAIIDDQLPLLLSHIEEIDFATILANNPRFRIPAPVFREIHDLLYGEIEQRVSRQDGLFLAKATRYLPTLEKENYLLPIQLTKMVFNGEVRRHLLSDVWTVGERLRNSQLMMAEIRRGINPLALLEAFDELARAVQRFEILSYAREHVRLIPPMLTDHQIQMRHGTVRVYHFSESVEVSGNAVNATVMFLDLRGFTKTSEGLVSERDLTRELYKVFDRFVEVIDRFGGEVDKFLGDGMMITFGVRHSSRYGPLNALRAAVLLQEKIEELRKTGETQFVMGVSIHYGRVYLAHFIGSGGGQDTTVIGRNVNIAGRLSSASKKPQGMEEGLEEGADDSRSGESQEMLVRINREGTLFNQGIAISRETVQAVEEVLPVSHPDDEELYGEVYDPAVQKKIRLHYVGDAKFKGVGVSLPIYSVDWRVGD